MTLKFFAISVKHALASMKTAVEACDDFTKAGVFEETAEELELVFTVRAIRAAISRTNRVRNVLYGTDHSAIDELRSKPFDKLKSLKNAVTQAQTELESAISELDAFVDGPENNRFADVDTARAELEDRFRSRAYAECEDSYNCGQPQYTQEFTTDDGKSWLFVMDVEYNRHDKTYYYVDGVSISIKEASDEQHSNPVPKAQGQTRPAERKPSQP